MQGSPEQPRFESEQDREERLYADILAAESAEHEIMTQLDLLIKSHADKNEIEAMCDRYDDAWTRHKHAIDAWLAYVDDILNER